MPTTRAMKFATAATILSVLLTVTRELHFGRTTTGGPGAVIGRPGVGLHGAEGGEGEAVETMREELFRLALGMAFTRLNVVFQELPERAQSITNILTSTLVRFTHMF